MSWSYIKEIIPINDNVYNKHFGSNVFINNQYAYINSNDLGSFTLYDINNFNIQIYKEGNNIGHITSMYENNIIQPNITEELTYSKFELLNFKFNIPNIQDNPIIQIKMIDNIIIVQYTTLTKIYDSSTNIPIEIITLNSEEKSLLDFDGKTLLLSIPSKSNISIYRFNGSWGQVNTIGYDDPPSKILIDGEWIILVYIGNKIKIYKSFVEFSTIQPTELIPTDEFGYSVSLQNNTMSVGIPGKKRPSDLTGVVYVYRFDGITWNIKQILSPMDMASRFGESVSHYNDHMIIGAPETIIPLSTYRKGTSYLFKL
jgi:hypothetical protein